jgi:beta-lactamase superfamily II metal-dependent hydrolase
LKKIAPNYSFYSSGDVNGTKYGLPNLQALQRIKPYSGTNIYGTEFCGNISFRISHETGKLVLDESYEKTTTA